MTTQKSFILRLTWSETNDYFDVEPENIDFCSWFVEQCNQFNNDFVCQSSQTRVDQLITDLKNNLIEANEFLNQIKFPEIVVFDNLFDQNNLNAIHKSWINVLRKEPRIDRLFYKKNPELFRKFHDINLLVHELENQFKYKLSASTHWRVNNKFQGLTPSNEKCNVHIEYTDWGKSSWHKFVDGVADPVDFELSNWQTIGSDIGINLSYPYKQDFPQPYLEYCLAHKIDPVVQHWPVGNLVDYQNNMPLVRKIMHKNIQIPKNKLQFSMVQ